MKRIVIIGGGPAGLTAALELARRGGARVIVLEREPILGGIARTLEHNGNRIDIGGHRFFSKSGKVMAWWKGILPLQGRPSEDDAQLQREVPLAPDGPDPAVSDRVMLVRSRLSRILFLRKFFDYPVSLGWRTLRNLGLPRVVRMALSYVWSLVHKRREKSLEDFFINRFGKELYTTFFRDYTAKVWGVPCSQIPADWGVQRVKGVSVAKVVAHAFGKLAFWKKRDKQGGETSLIEEFWYPKFGPGQLWEEVGRLAQGLGVKIRRRTDVTALDMEDGRVTAVHVKDLETGSEEVLPADAVISSAAIKDLAAMVGDAMPPEVREVAQGLVYRDFMTVGVLLDRLKLKSGAMNTTVGKDGIVFDNWIYVQEPDVKVGRLQLFNNWSPYLVADRSKVWLGMEYFVREGDDLWNMEDSDFADFALGELEKIGVIAREDVCDTKVYRTAKAYPAYFGSYSRFDKVREWLDGVPNLYPVGRNGMHRYNNMDHSMLSAMAAVECIAGVVDKVSIWLVNAEKEYHESK